MSCARDDTAGVEVEPGFDAVFVSEFESAIGEVADFDTLEPE
jgi:hypothetical protein